METSKTDGKRRMKEVGKEKEAEEVGIMAEEDIVGEDSKRRRAAVALSTVSQRKTNNLTGGVTITQPCCQVEDCRADLKDAKAYHRRHKVCEHHSKAPLVLVAGIRQRFCQQCSRFHDLAEFDEAKRSCRRRLAGHNERRRKSSYDAHGDG